MSLTRIILFSWSKNTGYGLEWVYISRPIWYNKIRRFVLHVPNAKVYFTAIVIVPTRNYRRTFPRGKAFHSHMERRAKMRHHIHNENHAAQWNYSGAKAHLKQSGPFMSIDRYRKMKSSTCFYWFQIVRVLWFMHMGNRVATAGVSAAYTSKLIRDISITRTEAGNKNIMRDKRVKAYSNFRPVLLTFISTVALT